MHHDIELARLARRQKGLVTSAQLAQLGFERGAVAYRLRCGRLHRLHRGVYAVGHAALAARARELAAVLACGAGAVLSHASAAALLGFGREDSGPVNVTVPGRHRRDRPGVRLHRTRSLSKRQTTARHGIPVTTAARTLLDLARTLDSRSLERAVDEAIVRRAASERALCAAVAAASRHPGSGRLRELLGGDRPVTRSVAEDRFRRLMVAAELPAPRMNARLAGYEVDAYWPAERLVVEIDGFRFHSTPAALDRDHRRDTALRAAGLRVRRVTWRRLERTPTAVVAMVAAALEAADG